MRSLLMLGLMGRLLHAGAIEPLAELPFQFREGLLWIKVGVPQSSEPLNFLLDSGASVSVLNLETARRLGLKGGQRVSVRGVKTVTSGFWPQPMEARIGHTKLPEKYLVLDLSSLGKACASNVDGLIGADFFRGRIVQIDFAGEKVRLLQSPPPSFDAALPLHIRTCGMRVPVTVNGGKQSWVRLDTGCASALEWVATGGNFNGCKRETAVGLSPISVAMTQTSVRLGNTEFQCVPTGCHSKEIFAGEAGLLGNGLLSRFAAITFDAKAGSVFLHKRQDAE